MEIGQKLPNLKFQFIPCSCALGSFNEFLVGINKEFDLVSSVYDVNLLKKYNEVVKEALNYVEEK